MYCCIFFVEFVTFFKRKVKRAVVLTPCNIVFGIRQTALYIKNEIRNLKTFQTSF